MPLEEGAGVPPKRKKTIAELQAEFERRRKAPRTPKIGAPPVPYVAEKRRPKAREETRRGETPMGALGERYQALADYYAYQEFAKETQAPPLPGVPTYPRADIAGGRLVFPGSLVRPEGLGYLPEQYRAEAARLTAQATRGFGARPNVITPRTAAMAGLSTGPIVRPGGRDVPYSARLTGQALGYGERPNVMSTDVAKELYAIFGYEEPEEFLEDLGYEEVEPGWWQLKPSSGGGKGRARRGRGGYGRGYTPSQYRGAGIGLVFWRPEG